MKLGVSLLLFASLRMMASIISTVEGVVGPIVTQVLTLLQGLPVWAQAAALLGVAIFAIVGIFVFLKRFIKLFIILAILGGIGYYLYFETDIITNLLNGSNPSAIITWVKGFPF